MSSGEVSTRTRITLWPWLLSVSASSDEKTISPQAAPGEAGRPVAITLRSAEGSMVGCRSWSGAAGATRLPASSFLINLSCASSTAIRNAALAGRLPLRVCSIHSLPCSTVNSRYCMSRLCFSRAAWMRLRWGRADAGDHALALRVDEELAVEFFLAGRRIARKCDSGRRGLAHIAKNHGLHVNRRAPAFRNAVQAPIGDRAWVHPRAEHGADGAPQLRVRVVRKRLTRLVLDALLVADDKLLPVGGLEVSVERVAVAVLVLVEDFLEVMVRNAEHDVRVHGDKAPVAVIGESPVA